jgi:transcriptional regulator with XRE-family HTH domain
VAAANKTLARISKTLHADLDKRRALCGPARVMARERLISIRRIGDPVARSNIRPVDALVGQNIRILRLQRGLSQTALGERMGVTFQQVQKYERGANRVGAGRLSQIAEALDVPLNNLFDGRPAADRSDTHLTAGALLADPHSLRLVQAFDQIASQKRRLAILRLIESVGGTSTHRQRSGNGRRRAR